MFSIVLSDGILLCIMCSETTAMSCYLSNMQIKTHSEKGERERYFQDDDKHDLKSLVSAHVHTPMM